MRPSPLSLELTRKRQEMVDKLMMKGELFFKIQELKKEKRGRK